MSGVPSTSRVCQISSKGAPFTIVERATPIPGPGEVLLKIEAAAFCRGDAVAKEGHWPNVHYPVIPSHEFVGRAVQIGPEVPDSIKLDGRYGVGWCGGFCSACGACKLGQSMNCVTHMVSGISVNGGLGEYVIVRHEATVPVPDLLSSPEAAPLLCAGFVVNTALVRLLHHNYIKKGDYVAVLGMGGLGHLAVLYAVKQGYNVVALSGGSSKRDLSLSLGAKAYIDTSSPDAVANLVKVTGGIGPKAFINTAPSGAPVEKFLGSIAWEGALVNVADTGADMISVSGTLLLMKRVAVMGDRTGTVGENAENLRAAVELGVRPIVERFSFTEEGITEAYNKMMANTVQFRAVVVL
ncbi:zinc-type alcohol dehydrogenase [Cladochytrium replicatum]|nr:zinc-type alcohol dehydrogenase [Cladochytrium replicatum]